MERGYFEGGLDSYRLLEQGEVGLVIYYAISVGCGSLVFRLVLAFRKDLVCIGIVQVRI